MKRSPSDTQGQPSHLDLKCRQCGATISHDKIREKVFQCEYCGASNVVPEKLWNYLHPSASPIESGGPPPGPFPIQDAYQPVPAAPGARKSNVSVVLASAFVLGIIAVGAAVSMFLMRAKPPSGSPAAPAEIVSESDIVPSMEKADPDKTMARIFEAVRKRWSPKALIGEVYISRLRADGTLDLKKEGGSISMEFFIPEMAAGLLPGETDIKNAKFSVYAGGGIVNPSVGNATLYDFKSGRFASVLPACTIASLVKAAHKEGYPAAGFANASFPEVPQGIDDSWDKLGLPSYVPGRKKAEDSDLTKAQEEKLASLLAQKGWLENAVYTYRYYVNGFEAGDLADLFSAGDCSPLGEWGSILPKFIDSLGPSEEAPSEGEAPPSLTKVTTRDIQMVFKTHIPLLRKCFEKLRAEDPSIGIVTLPITVNIGPGGDVKSVSVDWKGIKDKAFRKCLTGSIMQWTFPASQAPYTLTYPITFSGG